MVGTISASGVEGGEVLREAPEADVVMSRVIPKSVNYRQVACIRARVRFRWGACVLGSGASPAGGGELIESMSAPDPRTVLHSRLAGVAAAAFLTGCPLFSCRHRPRAWKVSMWRRAVWLCWGIGRGLRFRWGACVLGSGVVTGFRVRSGRSGCGPDPRTVLHSRLVGVAAAAVLPGCPLFLGRHQTQRREGLRAPRQLCRPKNIGRSGDPTPTET